MPSSGPRIPDSASGSRLRQQCSPQPGRDRRQATPAAQRILSLSLLVALCVTGLAAAQSAPPSVPPTAPPGQSVRPQIFVRTPDGKAVVQATRIATPPKIDGQLDEALYTTIPSMTDFIQTEPAPGTPATERTEVWLMFDDSNVYVTVRCWETHPERRVANDMRRDSSGVALGNDNISFMFDTFHDRRNAFTFAVNALGGRNDGQVTNQRQYNGDFNPIWNLRAGRYKDHWAFEAAIPFKSLRYGPGSEQVWGFNVVRTVRWKNETAFLTRVPPAIGANSGIMYASFAATMEGLTAPPQSRLLEAKPYVTGSLLTDRLASPRLSNDPSADAGMDAKVGITTNLTADLTLNTDFAQVEADEQQVNLTRFNLFFPEKREFFLENQGVFAFGGTGTSGGVNDVPIMFYSRRIGLSQGREVAIGGGGRLTGRVGRTTIGALNIQSRADDAIQAPSTNFSVLRVKRDILRKSNIGALYTHRSRLQSGAGSNDAYGADASFTFFDNVFVNAFWAQTRTDGIASQDVSYRGQFDYAADRYGVQTERLVVGKGFLPDIGFVRRGDMEKTYGLFRFSPRLKKHKRIRKLNWTSSFAYVENGAGRLDTRDTDTAFSIEQQNSDKFTVGYHQTYEYIAVPFRIATGVAVPVRGYDYQLGRASYTFGQQRPLFGTVSLEGGSFYDGSRLTLGLSGARVRITTPLSVEPSFSINRVSLPAGRFTTRLVGSRVTYNVTPWMYASALVQYNSSINGLAANVRFRWEYQPGSELFVVFNEQLDTRPSGFPDLQNRSFIVKINRLIRF